MTWILKKSKVQKKGIEKNLLDLYPKRNRDWEKTDENLVVILIPKLGNHFLGRLIKPQLKNPNYRLKSDEIGSFVWEHCNGSDNVEVIGNNLKKKFGDTVEPVYERLSLFFKSLENSNSIIWQ